MFLKTIIHPRLSNNALKSGDTEKSDGIVTAEKILGLRLRGTT